MYNETNVLKKFFPTKKSASVEMINLRAILALPKGTEHFLSDLHGENETFNHLLRNASGVIKQKIKEAFGKGKKEKEVTELATLIYYPSERLQIIKAETEDLNGWYTKTLYDLTEMVRVVASKYTRSKVRKALPKTYAYILDELINIPVHLEDKDKYYADIVKGIIELGEADDVIRELCHLIQSLAIDTLHIVGDIYDRGSGADKIMDTLIKYHSLDIQWGNHDILWLGAYYGNLGCILNALRINIKYNNLHILENAYGINLRALYYYSALKYKNDDCSEFKIKTEKTLTDEVNLAKMHKAVTLLQFKAEHALIKKHPEYGMNDRLFVLDKLGIEEEFDEEEKNILEELVKSFKESKRLKEHMAFLLEKGSLYKTYNGNLLMHGCVPTDEDGEFTEVEVMGSRFKGVALYRQLEYVIRSAKTNELCCDYMWYLWCGKNSPVYGRNVMATYEEYFDKKAFSETKNHYYEYVKNKDYCEKILSEFGLDPETGHIINGHMPVKVKSGESPVDGEGKHITIDGGMNKAYHKTTGIAGYTLISNSHGLILVSHAPFGSKKEAINNMIDLESRSTMIEKYPSRVYVRETDTGKFIQSQIDALNELYKNY